MKEVSGLSVLLLAGTFVMSPAANAATVLTAKNGMTVYVFDKDERLSISILEARVDKNRC